MLGVAGLLWLALAALILVWPDAQDVERTRLLGILAAGLGVGQLAVWVGGWFSPRLARLGRFAPWLVVLALWLAAWEAATAKLDLLPLPFFPSPQAFVEVYTDDWRRLGDSLLASLLAAGARLRDRRRGGLRDRRGAGLVEAGRLLDPSDHARDRPAAGDRLAAARLLRVSHQRQRQHLPDRAGDGLPASPCSPGRAWPACRPPTTTSPAPWAPTPRFLILKVAIPAALPHVFVGLFMGLGSSFAVLVVAEMLGVKSGLGWYLQWAQGWAAYANMYGALLVMALMCSTLITLLFRLRDRLLAWQKGLVKW